MSNDTAQATELHGKELAFALAWIELGPCTGRNKKAAVKAGYAQHSASVTGARLIKKPNIAAYVRERESVIIKHIEDKQLVTREQLISRLHKIYEQSMIGDPEMVWKDGELVHSGFWTFNDRGACRAVELLGKTIGMFSEKQDPKKETPFHLNIILVEPEPRRSKVIDNQPTTPTINMEPIT